MTYSEYLDYLHSPTWRVRAAQIRGRADFHCENCGRDDLPLEVHHLTYQHVGDESPEELLALCPPCHRRAHADRPLPFVDAPRQLLLPFVVIVPRGADFN